MPSREDLSKMLSTTIADYRDGEIVRPTPEHIERWVYQFDRAAQEPILAEMNHVMKAAYISKAAVTAFLTGLLRNKELAGDDPAKFWAAANFLDIQKNGHSQSDMLAMFDQILQRELNLRLRDCGSKDGPFIYLDDGIYTGNRLGADVDLWLVNKSPPVMSLHVVVMAMHKLGAWQAKERIEKKAHGLGKKIRVRPWCVVEIENRKKYRDISEVLWPAQIPASEQLKSYLAEPTKFPFEQRNVVNGAKYAFFSSEHGRQLLEREMLLAGIKIRGFSKKPSPIIRPLGFSAFGLGFGSTVVTYRNCANNCPLAFWWGDPNAGPNSPLSKWYPLFPRKTYAQDPGFNVISDE